MTSKAPASAPSLLASTKSVAQQIAQSVAPGAKLTPYGGSGLLGPLDCTSPNQGLVYYTLSQQFDAPEGSTGASVLTAIQHELDGRGYTTKPGQVSGQPSLRATNASEGWSIIGSDADRSVQLLIDTPCGSAGEATPGS